MSARSPRRTRLTSLLLTAALAAGSSLLAWNAPAEETEPLMNRVSFQVAASRDVENDQVSAVLGTNEEDPDPAALADKINKTMRWALDTARAAKGVTVRSGGYQTYPVHDKNRIVRWRGSQDLILESGDVDAISKLIGALQSRLQVGSVQFSVSDERRRSVEDELIRETLEAYKARAQIVRVGLESSGYELVQLSVNSGGGPQPYMRAKGMAMAAEVATPSFESGTSELTVSINATIELQ